MKYNLPNILLNPNKYDYSLNDIEIGYFQDAKKDLIKKYHNLVSKSIWKAILSNLKRRIEFYWTSHLKQGLDENEKKNYIKYNELNDKVKELINVYNNKPNEKNIIKLLHRD